MKLMVTFKNFTQTSHHHIKVDAHQGREYGMPAVWDLSNTCSVFYCNTIWVAEFFLFSNVLDLKRYKNNLHYMPLEAEFIVHYSYVTYFLSATEVYKLRAKM